MKNVTDLDSVEELDSTSLGQFPQDLFAFSTACDILVGITRRHPVLTALLCIPLTKRLLGSRSPASDNIFDMALFTLLVSLSLDNLQCFALESRIRGSRVQGLVELRHGFRRGFRR